MLERVRIKVRKKGQVTLPHSIREKLGIAEGSEVEISSVDDDKAVLKPIRKVDIRRSSGLLGEPRKRNDEIEFASLDPELIPRYYSKKYR
jgi:AbrB family looped-hinge helix DNA binding protein